MSHAYVTVAIRTVALVAATLTHAQQPVASPADLFQKAAVALGANDLPNAEAGFRAVIHLDPHSAAAFTNLGVTLMREKRWPDALAALQHAQRLDPTMTGIHLDLGLTHFHTANYTAAAPEFRAALTQSPQNTQARFLLGLSCFFIADYTCTTENLERLWPAQSTNLTYLYVLGSAAGRAKQPELAIRAFQQMAAAGQGSPEFHLYAGKAALGKGDFLAATAELEQALAAQPTLPMAHFFLAEALDGGHRTSEARAALEAETHLEPDLPYAFDELGRICVELNDPTAAEAAYRAAIARTPALSSAYLGLAALFRPQSRAAEALPLLDRAVELAPNSGSVHYARGQVLRQLHREPEARTEFARAASLLRQFHEDLQQKGLAAHAADAAEIRQAAEL